MRPCHSRVKWSSSAWTLLMVSGLAHGPSARGRKRSSSETGSFQDRDVLLHRREAHVVVGGQVRDRHLPDEGATQDVAPRRVGERPEDPVHLVVGEVRLRNTIYNHLVVD